MTKGNTDHIVQRNKYIGIVKSDKYDSVINGRLFSIIITAAVCTPNRRKLSSGGTSLSGENSRDFESDLSLRQSKVTKVDLFEFFPVRFTEVLTAFLSDGVVGCI